MIERWEAASFKANVEASSTMTYKMMIKIRQLNFILETDNKIYDTEFFIFRIRF